MNEGYLYRERIGPDAAGRSLLQHLSRRRAAPISEWAARIQAGQVLLDGAPAEAGAVLRAGQELAWQRPPWQEPEVPLCAAVLYQDEDLLAVAKPRGLPTLPGGGEFLEHTLLSVVRRRVPEASPMHRLGRGTSGLVLFARTAAARSAVQRAFRARSVRKVYRGLCAGAPAADAFAVDAPIGKVAHPLLGSVHGASAGGKPSRSTVRVLQRREAGSLVEVEIETGRPHQIRIHLAFAGHPLRGDPLYGPGGTPLASAPALPSDLGYWLHAGLLSLPHPRTGKELVLECSPPLALQLQP
jgi:23S rRNA pseudouridine1911/1915/1917 synthase